MAPPSPASDEQWQAYLSPGLPVGDPLPSSLSFDQLDTNGSSNGLPASSSSLGPSHQANGGPASEDPSSESIRPSHPSGLVAPPDLLLQELHTDGTPKRPMNAFMIYARHRRPVLLEEHPGIKTGPLSQKLSTEWKSLSVVDKAFYLEQAKILKDHFHKKFPNYVYKRRPNNQGKRKSGHSTSYRGSGSSRGSSTDSSDSVVSSYSSAGSPLPSPRPLPSRGSPLPSSFSPRSSYGSSAASPSSRSLSSLHLSPAAYAVSSSPYSSESQASAYTSWLTNNSSLSQTPPSSYTLATPYTSSLNSSTSSSRSYASPARARYASSMPHSYNSPPVRGEVYEHPEAFSASNGALQRPAVYSSEPQHSSPFEQHPMTYASQAQPSSSYESATDAYARASSNSFARSTARTDRSPQATMAQAEEEPASDRRHALVETPYTSDLLGSRSFPTLPMPRPREQHFQSPAFSGASYAALSPPVSSPLYGHPKNDAFAAANGYQPSPLIVSTSPSYWSPSPAPYRYRHDSGH